MEQTPVSSTTSVSTTFAGALTSDKTCDSKAAFAEMFQFTYFFNRFQDVDDLSDVKQKVEVLIH